MKQNTVTAANRLKPTRLKAPTCLKSLNNN